MGQSAPAYQAGQEFVVDGYPFVITEAQVPEPDGGYSNLIGWRPGVVGKCDSL